LILGGSIVEDMEFFTLTDEKGNENDFMFLKELEIDGKTYWICQEAIRDEEKQEMILNGVVAFAVEKEEGKIYLNSIDDEDEFKKVSDVWESIEDEVFSSFDLENESDFEEYDVDFSEDDYSQKDEDTYSKDEDEDEDEDFDEDWFIEDEDDEDYEEYDDFDDDLDDDDFKYGF
jgi:uncharacterized protein YrzB (UPF0473 family)